MVPSDLWIGKCSREICGVNGRETDTARKSASSPYSIARERPMKPAIIFIWANFGPYHIDRLEAATEALRDSHRIIGIEIAGHSQIYPWSRTEKVSGFERVTLFPDRQFETLSAWRILIAMARACLKFHARQVFLCHYERIDTNMIAWLLRFLGFRTHVMIESKFDDKPRFLRRELLKKIFFLPYNSAIVGGERSRDYLRFFGFDLTKIYFGYDTVSMDRIRQLAGSPPAPDGVGFNNRHFTIVARLVPKKNIITALAAYADYCKLAGSNARELHICGSGELESELRAAAKRLSVDGVVFRGFVQSPEVARVLSSTLALILPSVEEQWGLVVNEALAMGVPILCSLNAGARDLLVRTAINGYIFEPDNPDGLARLLYRLGSDEAEWRRLAEGSTRLTPLADTAQFGAAVCQIIGETSARQSQRYQVFHFRGKPIIAIPVGTRVLRLSAISKFQPYSPKRSLFLKFLKTLVVLGCDRILMGSTMWESDIVSPSFGGWIQEMRVLFKEANITATVMWPPQLERRRVYAHLLRLSGESLAFCKVALGPLDYEIFRSEIDCLIAVHDLRLHQARIPTVICSGSFADIQYLALEPFPDGTVPYVSGWSKLSSAVQEYSGPYRSLTRDEIKRLKWWERFERQRNHCNAVFQEQLDKTLTNAVRVSRVHGDLIPANLFSHAGKLWICDWEFSSPAGPYRTDELCYRLSLHHALSLSNPRRVATMILREMGEGGFNIGEFLLALAFLVGRNFAPAISLAQNWEFLEG